MGAVGSPGFVGSERPERSERKVEVENSCFGRNIGDRHIAMSCRHADHIHQRMYFSIIYITKVMERLMIHEWIGLKQEVRRSSYRKLSHDGLELRWGEDAGIAQEFEFGSDGAQ